MPDVRGTMLRVLLGESFYFTVVPRSPTVFRRWVFNTVRGAQPYYDGSGWRTWHPSTLRAVRAEALAGPMLGEDGVIWPRVSVASVQRKRVRPGPCEGSRNTVAEQQRVFEACQWCRCLLVACARQNHRARCRPGPPWLDALGLALLAREQRYARARSPAARLRAMRETHAATHAALGVETRGLKSCVFCVRKEKTR